MQGCSFPRVVLLKEGGKRVPFVELVRGLSSLSIVGTAKNVGKTETLNYLLRRMREENFSSVALTSIGVDGEVTDQVTQTPKPEIVIPAGFTFVTSENHYTQRQLTSCVTGLSDNQGALGRFIFARAQIAGKAILSGPSTSRDLERLIARLHREGVKLVLVDGALSRVSLASPSVADGMILATGAALSVNPAELVRRTAFLLQLVNLPLLDDAALASRLRGIEQGVWAVDGEGVPHDLEIPSVFLLDRAKVPFDTYGDTLYVPGAITDRLLNQLRAKRKRVRLVAQDFTRFFVEPLTFHNFIKSGCEVCCLDSTRLIAVTFNPFSPQGYHLDSVRLRAMLREALQLPVYDVRDLARNRW